MRSILCLLLVAMPLTAEPPKEQKEFELTKEEKQLLDLTNAERNKAGLMPMKPSAKLMISARAHCANMAAKNQLSHVLDDKGPGERLAAVGYVHRGWAENVAAGQRTAAEVMQSWMNSPGHQMNILSAHREIGVGIATTPQGTRYWTQVFANPAP